MVRLALRQCLELGHRYDATWVAQCFERAPQSVVDNLAGRAELCLERPLDLADAAVFGIADGSSSISHDASATSAQPAHGPARTCLASDAAIRSGRAAIRLPALERVRCSRPDAILQFDVAADGIACQSPDGDRSRASASRDPMS